MSFRVHCSENYYGPNCTTLCESVEGVYTCDSEGRVVCVQDNRDPATNCTHCLHGWDAKTNCTTCSLSHDDQSDCTQCLAVQDIITNCTVCLPGYNPSTNSTECFLGYDLSTDCTEYLVQCQPTQEPSTTSGKFEHCTHSTVIHMYLILCLYSVISSCSNSGNSWRYSWDISTYQHYLTDCCGGVVY